MLTRKETLFEKIITPLPVTVMSFVGFIAYIFVYVKNLPRPDLTVMMSSVILLGCILIFRYRLRRFFIKEKKFSPTKKGMLPTPDEVMEIRQKNIDEDSKYFGMIIFVLSTMYLAFIEVAKFF